MSLSSSLSEAEIRRALRGCVSVESTADGLIPWRLRHQDRALIHPDLLKRVVCTSGVRLHFRTRASGIRLSVTPEVTVPFFAKGEALFDLFIDGSCARTVTVTEEGRQDVVFSDLPDGEKEIEIYFPQQLSTTIHTVELTGDAALLPTPDQPLWITHGSSITHCRGAASPAFTWPAIVAREQGWNHWNMGYGGECRFDQIVARTIRDMAADRISLCLGINTAVGSYSARTWRPAVEGFLMTVRDGHPETPLLIISPILSPPRETQEEPPCTLALQTMRRELTEIVATFQSAGDRHLHYLCGLEIIGPGDEATMPDELHPDADGIKLMARRFLDRAPGEWIGRAGRCGDR